MLADQHGITTGRQRGSGRGDVRGVEGCAAEVGEDQGRRHRRNLRRGVGPWHEIGETARSGTHLALAVRSHAPAWPELHALGTPEVDHVLPPIPAAPSRGPTRMTYPRTEIRKQRGRFFTTANGQSQWSRSTGPRDRAIGRDCDFSLAWSCPTAWSFYSALPRKRDGQRS